MEEIPGGKGLFVVGLSSGAKDENTHPKQFARRTIFLDGHRENAPKYLSQQYKRNMYQKESKMVLIDSTGGDEGSCGAKDDTKHYDKHEKQDRPRIFSMLLLSEGMCHSIKSNPGDRGGGTALTI